MSDDLNEITKPARPWWRKKRWWAVGIVLANFLFLNTEYSLRGPSLSCVQIWFKSAAEKRLKGIVSASGGNADAVFLVLENAGYKSTGGRDVDGGVLYTFLYRYSDIDHYVLRCFPLNLLSSDGARIQISTEKINGKEVVRDVKKNG